MNDILITVAVLVGIFVLLPIGVLHLKERLQGQSPAEMAEYSQRFTERLHQPDFGALESHYGASVPAALRALYSNSEELGRGDFEVAPRIDADEEDRWFMEFYQPADSEALKVFWPGTERYFAFADDGAGNEYLIDPRLPDPPVQFHDHETGEFSPVCDSFVEFMTWPRWTTPED